MYSTCLFCLKDLGHNTVLEPFPVGRRLAFDSARGRLWVVCRRCQRWNLTPLDERWEAIEVCERHYHDTRLRVSTDQMGLARLDEGLELIRIGNPQRPEFAAWRYGDQLGRRRRRNLIQAGLGIGAVGGIALGSAAIGIGVGGLGYGLYLLADRIIHGSPDKVLIKVPTEDTSLMVRRKHLSRLRLSDAGEGNWQLSLKRHGRVHDFRGPEALRLTGALLPHLNRYGGAPARVQAAVKELEQSRDPIDYFAIAAKRLGPRGSTRIATFPLPVRLALEMAAHEESERRAIEGELAVLERAWREAEEIAAIADNLLIPAAFEEFIQRHRQRKEDAAKEPDSR